MDPYVYPNSSVLINKLNIQNEQQLINVEAQLLIAGIIDIHSILDDLDFRNYTCLQTIHRFLFEDLYELVLYQYFNSQTHRTQTTDLNKVKKMTLAKCRRHLFSDI